MWNRWSSIESTSTILQLQLLNFVVSVDHGKTPPPKTSLIGDHGISATSLKIISHWLRFFLSSPSSHFPQQATSRGGSGLDFSSKQKTIQCYASSRLVMVCAVSLELGTNIVDWGGGDKTFQITEWDTHRRRRWGGLFGYRVPGKLVAFGVFRSNQLDTTISDGGGDRSAQQAAPKYKSPRNKAAPGQAIWCGGNFWLSFIAVLGAGISLDWKFFDFTRGSRLGVVQLGTTVRKFFGPNEKLSHPGEHAIRVWSFLTYFKL